MGSIMGKINKIARKYNEEIFFFVLILSGAFSIRKILLFYSIGGQFNEHLAVYISAFDVIFLLWAVFIILKHKIILMSMIRDGLLSLKDTYTQFVHEHSRNKLATEQGVARMGSKTNKMAFLSQKTKNSWRSCLTRATLFFMKKDKNVPRGTFFLPETSKSYTHIRNIGIIIPPIIIFFIATASIFWSRNKILSIQASFRVFEWVSVYLYVIWFLGLKCSTWNIYAQDCPRDNVPRGTFYKKCFIIGVLLVFIGTLNAIVAIFQFLIQKSIGLRLLGESIISSNGYNVAKVVIQDNKVLRSYGLFPHPNILAFFLLVTIFVSLYLLVFKIFHVEHLDDKRVGSMKKWPIYVKNVMYVVILAINVVAFGLTFSKEAVLGGIVSVIITLSLFKLNVPRGTFIDSERTIQMFHVEHLYRKLLLLLSIVLSILLFLNLGLSSSETSFSDRAYYLNRFESNIGEKLFLGVGAGNYVWTESQSIGVTDLETWKIQPVHNVFLLVFSELGLFGGVLFFFWIAILAIFLLKNNLNVPRGTFCSECDREEKNIFCTGNNKTDELDKNQVYINRRLLAGIASLAFVSMIVVMLLDHFFWDIQQGRILLAIISGYVAGIIIKS